MAVANSARRGGGRFHEKFSRPNPRTQTLFGNTDGSASGCVLYEPTLVPRMLIEKELALPVPVPTMEIFLPVKRSV